MVPFDTHVSSSWMAIEISVLGFCTSPFISHHDTRSCSSDIELPEVIKKPQEVSQFLPHIKGKWQITSAEYLSKCILY